MARRFTTAVWKRVLQVRSESPVQLAVVQPQEARPPVLRPLGTVLTYSDPLPVVRDGPTQWTFEVAEPPVGMGLYLDDGGDGLYVAAQAQMVLASPAGNLIEATWNCYLCGGGATFGGGFANPDMVAGTYTASYTSAASESLVVGHVLVDYVR